jgi:3-oxoadipate enol-lactonase
MIASQLLEGTERQVLLTNGEWVEVVRLGSGDPIVLVPGLAGGWRLVAPLAQTLARRFEVIVCGHRDDRFPLGGSWARSITDHARDLSAVLDQLGLERPAVLGISFGGAVALELAVGQPHRLGALILNGVEARFRTSIGSTIARRVLERFPLPSDNGFLNQFFNLLHGAKPEPGPHADFVIERCWETDQSVMARRLALLESFDVADRLWRVEVPTLVLAGSRDVIVPPARQKALADAIPDARFETLDGAGHIGFLTHRRDLARKVAQMMRQLREAAC